MNLFKFKAVCVCGVALGLCGLSGAQVQNAGGTQADAAHSAQLCAAVLNSLANYIPLIQQYGGLSGVDPALIAAVMKVESDGDANCVSSAGAMGLMQLMPENCQDDGVQNPYDPEQNIRGGAAQLARLLVRYQNDLQKTLAGYNAGPRHADDGSWVNIPETRKYVPVVLSYYNALKTIPNPLQTPGTGSLAPSNPAAAPTPPPAPIPPATVHLVDDAFAIIYKAQIVQTPQGVAENGTLDEAADAMIQSFGGDKADSSKLTAKTAAYLAKAHYTYGSLHVFRLVTPDPRQFEAVWSKQPTVPGGAVGISYTPMKSGGGYIWIVIVASR